MRSRTHCAVGATLGVVGCIVLAGGLGWLLHLAPDFVLLSFGILAGAVTLVGLWASFYQACREVRKP